MSIAYWKDLARSAPEAAARELLARCAALTPAQQRSVLAWSHGDPVALARAFEKAAGSGGALAGVPFLVKDLFPVAGLRTGAGSCFLASLRGVDAAHSRAVSRFLDAGAVFAGKTQLHEFAYGLTGENPHFGDCFQQRHPDRLTGGSSSGSAFAVQAGLVPVALGTDTGGSIRLPSAFCGLHGFRLVPGAPSIADAFPLAHSYDTAGWFTNSAEDLAAVWRAWFPKAGAETGARGVFLSLADLGENERDTDRAVHALGERLAPRADKATREELRAAWQGSEVAFSVIQSTEAFATHEPWFDERRSQYDPAVWARVDRGRRWLPEQRANAEAVQARVRAVWDQFFGDFDFLVMPISPFPALRLAECTDEARARLLKLTTPASLGGLPALALPGEIGGGLTTAVQVLFKKPDAPWVEDVVRKSKQ